MNERLSAFVHDLYADGVTHDAAQPDRLLKRRNLEPVTAELLSLIVRCPPGGRDRHGERLLYALACRRSRRHRRKAGERRHGHER